MMRTILVLCLALVIALSFGCSKKKEEAPKLEAAKKEAARAGMISPTFDPVSKEDIDIATSPYSYEYNGVLYFFSSAQNMETFKANPAKYILPGAETPQTTPPKGQ
ncbi:MAG TPA: YHS domain-containing protein [Candidatus Krumholzibacteriaceae bacterium]